MSEQKPEVLPVRSMKIATDLTPADLRTSIQRLWDLSAAKIHAIGNTWHPSKGSPVFTVEGKYRSHSWTEWTQGFQFGSALLQFDATAESEFLELGRRDTLRLMVPHVTHFGVHDHGFNTVSTYGNLWRLMNEGRIDESPWERQTYELALKCSGSVQAKRWTATKEGGYIYSFNGPHSLFADTIRSLRVLALGHQLGHVLMDENDSKISLLDRLIQHARVTATYNVYYGAGRDAYDVWGRVAHESIFNINDGNYRCPTSQQGFSPFSTWTRGLAWIMCGYAEQLQFLDKLWEHQPCEDREETRALMLRAARACCDFYIENTPLDGVPYWDSGAPLLHKMGDYVNSSSDPYNQYEPVDSSAATIAAQGLLRLGRYLKEKGTQEDGSRYWQAGLTTLRTLLSEPYLSEDPHHQGLILHSVYHRPQGWDHIPRNRRIPCNESTMWGDYHAREAALYVQRLAEDEEELLFFRG